MVGGTRIIAFEPGGQEPQGDEFLLSEEVREDQTAAPDWPAEEDHAPALPGKPWLWPTLAGTAALAWTAFFGWARQAELSAAAPAAWPALVADWLVPVLAIGVLWLLLMRSSRREAMRFGEAARVLSDESHRLETRLTTINQELSLAREFIAAQARDLDALGRIAVERLSQNSDRLQSLIHDNGARIDSIGSVSQAALENMEKLRGQLPVIASSAKDVTNNIGNAGRTAAAQLADMVSGFDRLNSFGQASERQVQSLRERVDGALAEFAAQCEQLEHLADSRFASLSERGAAFRSQLDEHEAEAIAAVRARASALAGEVADTRASLDMQEQESLTSLRARLASLRDEGTAISRSIRDGETRSLESWRDALSRIEADLGATAAGLEAAERSAVERARDRLAALEHDASAIEAQLAERGRSFDAEMQQRLATFAASDAEAIARLGERLSALDAEIADRSASHERQSTAFAAHGEAVAARMAELDRKLADVMAHSSEAQTSFAASMDAFTGRLADGRAALAGTDRDIAALTDSSVRLLEILQASKQQTRDDLQNAISVSEARLTAFEARAAALRDTVAEAGEHGEALSGMIAGSHEDLRTALGELEQLQSSFAARNALHGEALGELRRSLTQIDEQSSQLAEKAQGELSGAIERLLASADAAVAAISDTGARNISAIADQLGHESGAAIDRAMRASAAEVSGQLEQAASHAAGVSREAAIQLRDQLAKVNELVGNLERRVAHARERAEEQVDNDFSRRAALITESLNSNAIDIAKALSHDVADTAWSAYLRGDRGIFTRRAVNLLESGEAKSIVQVFETDSDFRDHVSRYIHDFEAILRQVLSTRDGHSLGVTLLSSDMGKLYVALAQSIERLRS